MRPSSQLSQTSSGPLTRNERVRGTDAAGERLRIMTPKSDSGVAVTKGLPLFFFFPHTHSLSKISRAYSVVSREKSAKTWRLKQEEEE